jgi:ABC-type multidrug transport system ATPase subunit
VTAKPSTCARARYLPQDFGFYAHSDRRAMLQHLLALKGVRAPAAMKKLVSELLERVNSRDAAQRKVKGYSGGMRQRSASRRRSRAIRAS